MEVLLELVGVIIAFIIEVTIDAIVFIYLLVRAMFSAGYRRKLHEAWDTSSWKRFGIIFGMVMYATALAIALLVWIPLIGGSKSHGEEHANENQLEVAIEFTPEEVDEMKKTKEIQELADVAGNFIKRKLEERKQQKQAEQDATSDLLPTE